MPLLYASALPSLPISSLLSLLEVIYTSVADPCFVTLSMCSDCWRRAHLAFLDDCRSDEPTCTLTVPETAS